MTLEQAANIMTIPSADVKIASGNFMQCIPYNEKTWRLLGTADNYEEE